MLAERTLTLSHTRNRLVPWAMIAELRLIDIPSDESHEQGRNRSRELNFTAEQP